MEYLIPVMSVLYNGYLIPVMSVLYNEVPDPCDECTVKWST